MSEGWHVGFVIPTFFVEASLPPNCGVQRNIWKHTRFERQAQVATEYTDEMQTEVDPSLFDAPSEGGGGFWKATAGGKRGQLLRFEEGPEFENEKDVTVDGVKTKKKVKEKSVRWVFSIYRLNGKRVTFVPEGGEKAGQTLPATSDGLSSRVFSKGSKAGKWLGALLNREIDWKAIVAASPAEASAMKAALMQEAIGKWGLLSFGEAKGSDRIILKEIAVVDDDDDEEGDDD